MPERWTYALLFVLLLPACFIGLRTTHDWGDDFAQYLSQAHDLCEGRAIDPAEAVVNWADYGPAPKGLGFSFLLLPIQLLRGNEVLPYLVLNALVLVGVGLLLFRYLQWDFGPWPALLGVLLFAYDRHVLHAKSEIMPDLLFALVVLGSCCVLRGARTTRWSWIAVLAACAVLVKSGGWVLYATMALVAIREFRKTPEVRRITMADLLTLLLLPLMSAAGFTGLLSSVWSSDASWYGGVIGFHVSPATLMSNTAAYAASFVHFFEQELPLWMNRLLVPLVLLSIVAGVVRRARRGADAGDVFVALWMLLLLCYPYTNATDRFLLPVLPFALRYLLEGMHWVIGAVRLPLPTFMIVVPALFLATSVLTVLGAVRSGELPVVGPYSNDAQEALGMIARMTPTDALVGSARPWAVHLFTGRTTVWLPTPGEPMSRALRTPLPVPDLALLATSAAHKGMYDAPLLRAIMNDTLWSPIWRNDSFTLVQRKQTKR
ncbi:MAG: hypothetical protein ABI599_01415 [Flavobacteriales bacterium]